jgi:hypothetical protein
VCLALSLKKFVEEVQVSEEELELLITTDDPGEDTLEEDHFHLKADNTIAGQSNKGGELSNKQE